MGIKTQIPYLKKYALYDPEIIEFSLPWVLEDTAKNGIPQKYLGKLGIKHEPAGKVRVFAMVDCFTQWLMKPLHDAIFQTLKRIPQDGTFDQHRQVKFLLKRKSSFFSFDLSSATDRLPVSIQEILLLPPLGTKGASTWRSILVDRKYELPRGCKSKYNKSDSLPGSLPEYQEFVRYAVGQPMGALSS